MTEGEVWYRYEDHLVEGWPEPVVRLRLREFAVVRRTRCGAWLESFGERRFVLLNPRRRFACPTRAEALESFRARKRRQVGILRARLRSAEAALAAEPDE